MSTQRELATRTQFNFTPTTLKEAQEYATIFASSGLCPEAYRGRPNDILIVWQMGRELGLDKMQALRTLGCINGIPFAYGDGQLALVKRHPHFEDMKEWFEGNIKDGSLTAFCMIKRKDQEPVIREFSMEDAKLAGLWSKKGVWQQYPKRMLQHRARGFAAKDAFPDALYGLMSEDEAKNVVEAQAPTVEVKPLSRGMQDLEAAVDATIIEGETEEVKVEHEVYSEPATETVETAQPEQSELDQLKYWIRKTKTSGKAINTWLRNEGVARLEALSPEKISKAIEYFKSKEIV